MFSIAGLVMSKLRPADPKAKILGVNNRLVFAIGNAVFASFLEIFLAKHLLLSGSIPGGARWRCSFLFTSSSSWQPSIATIGNLPSKSDSSVVCSW